MEKRGNFLRNHWGKLTTAVALACGAVAFGPKTIGLVQDYLDPESDIVAGVPGQVENHLTDRYCDQFINNLCVDYDTAYYLGIEQCPADVTAAVEHNRQTTSFHPEVGVMSSDCYYDSVSVSLETWQAAVPGSTIVFGGVTGEHLSG